MRQYIIRRLFISIFILLGVSAIIYGLLRTAPADYVSTITNGIPDATPEMKAKLTELYGLDKGIVEGYVDWLSSALKGDLGQSFIYNKPAQDVIKDKMWVSFWMALPSFILQLLIAIPLGIISATKQYSITDYTVTTIALIGISLPSFFFAAVLQRAFSMGLGWFPLQGMVTAREDYVGFAHIMDMAWHFVLPITVLTVLSIGGLMRYSRTNMLEVLNADYIRTARAKGLSEHKVIYKHAFRNTLIPIVTMVGGMIPGLFSGAMITEGIFSIEGLGYIGLKALRSGDIPFMMAFTMFLAILTLLGTLLSDILYAVVDPRVRLK
ncbi:MAG: ABC transporter permease [Zhenhengia sp.]|jgi:peptide/nickel transport system permease protein|uniref:ABC transporter permease n=2 Tax=Zhenhengia yiwuensis TaxID=2763666 RepID=A0A926ICW2_9FIRM|nr:ABC transporter permease [Zhenhengia yiwuensis]MBC8578078.1 ABC transporter permease [Zhenhengia yiwuensis]MDU6359002.1 ABC transporter permease [Clostridiales bacterium]